MLARTRTLSGWLHIDSCRKELRGDDSWRCGAGGESRAGGLLVDGDVHNDGFISTDGRRWRPLGARFAPGPRQAEAVNLNTLTCPSSSHAGYGACLTSRHGVKYEFAMKRG